MVIHYPIPPHKQIAFKEWNNMYLSTTELIHDEVLSLPIYSTLSKDEIKHIVSTINEF
jgi:dTDP-4-amino-4,6-dideoxygalactose transaminase